MYATSIDVIEEKRRLEKKMSEAKTEEEKLAYAKESDIYKMVFVFSGQQAVIIKKVLGKTEPAQQLYNILENYYNSIRKD